MSFRVKRAEDDGVNPATGKPMWDQKAKVVPGYKNPKGTFYLEEKKKGTATGPYQTAAAVGRLAARRGGTSNANVREITFKPRGMAGLGRDPKTGTPLRRVAPGGGPQLAGLGRNRGDTVRRRKALRAIGTTQK